MANICLESVWRKRLTSEGWSERAAEQTLLHWASSTLSSYDRQINRLAVFCKDSGVMFPPPGEDSGTFADFMCFVADGSERPESALKCTSAAITCYYQGSGRASPMDRPDLRKLCSALVKSGTKRPSNRTPVMPCKPFHDMFVSWQSDETLSLTELRLKVVTLLALNMMTRPSDLAPKGMFFDAGSKEKTPILFTRDQVVFHADGSATFTLFGIKNDRSRSGFEVRLPGGANNKVDPVVSLQCYLRRTQQFLSGSPPYPVFLALRAPYKGISSGTIGQILSASIQAAGLGGMGYTMRSFRPTGATAAVQSGTKPETAMQIGRWKSDVVFRDRYVYPLADPDYTDNIINFTGLDRPTRPVSPEY